MAPAASWPQRLTPTSSEQPGVSVRPHAAVLASSSSSTSRAGMPHRGAPHRTHDSLLPPSTHRFEAGAKPVALRASPPSAPAYALAATSPPPSAPPRTSAAPWPAPAPTPRAYVMAASSDTTSRRGPEGFVGASRSFAQAPPAFLRADVDAMASLGGAGHGAQTPGHVHPRHHGGRRLHEAPAQFAAAPPTYASYVPQAPAHAWARPVGRRTHGAQAAAAVAEAAWRSRAMHWFLQPQIVFTPAPMAHFMGLRPGGYGDPLAWSDLDGPPQVYVPRGPSFARRVGRALRAVGQTLCWAALAAICLAVLPFRLIGLGLRRLLPEN